MGCYTICVLNPHLVVSTHRYMLNLLSSYFLLSLSICPLTASSQTLSHWCPLVSFLPIIPTPMLVTTTEPSPSPSITINDATSTSQHSDAHIPPHLQPILSIPPRKTQTPLVSVTLSRNKVFKPLTKLNFTAQLFTPSYLESTTMTQALKDPKWR